MCQFEFLLGNTDGAFLIGLGRWDVILVQGWWVYTAIWGRGI